MGSERVFNKLIPGQKNDGALVVLNSSLCYSFVVIRSRGIQSLCMKVCAGLASGKLFTTAVKSSVHLANRLRAYNNLCDITQFI